MKARKWVLWAFTWPTYVRGDKTNFVVFYLLVKAGGMRITSKHHQTQTPVLTPEEKAEEEEFAEPKEK